jgi:hypothetical protein
VDITAGQMGDSGGLMLRLVKHQKNDQGLYLAQILGPHGVIEIRDLVWVTDRQDLLEIYYWESWAVLNGSYHCCFSTPGKVLLIE